MAGCISTKPRPRRSAGASYPRACRAARRRQNLSQGAAYIFTQSGSTWTQQAELTASDGATGDNFGDAVAVSGAEVLVGAPAHTVGSNTLEGAAYVFTGSGASWTQQAELTASDGVAGDNFGTSVGLSGTTALVGSPGHAVGSNGSQGAAYVFTASAGSWSQRTELTASDGVAGDTFGDSAALSGTTVLVGASESSALAPGAAYVFTGSGPAGASRPS